MTFIFFQPSSCRTVRLLQGFEEDEVNPAGVRQAIYDPAKSALVYEAFRFDPDKGSVSEVHVLFHGAAQFSKTDRKTFLDVAVSGSAVPSNWSVYCPTFLGVLGTWTDLAGNFARREKARQALIGANLRNGSGWIMSSDLQNELDGVDGSAISALPSIGLPSPLRCLGARPEAAMYDPLGPSLSLTGTIDGHDTTVDFRSALFLGVTPEEEMRPGDCRSESSYGVVARARDSKDWRAEERQIYRPLEGILRGSEMWERYTTWQPDMDPLALPEPAEFADSVKEAWSKMMASIAIKEDQIT